MRATLLALVMVAAQAGLRDDVMSIQESGRKPAQLHVTPAA